MHENRIMKPLKIVQKGEGVIRKSNKGGDFDQSMHAWKYHSENPLFTINTC
jgi:hypothetical protein